MSNSVHQSSRSESGPSESRPVVMLNQLVLERIHCPLCGCEDAEIVLHAVDNLCGVPGQFAVERCQACRHMFMNPRPTMDSMVLCYPSHYGPHQSAPEQQSTDESSSIRFGAAVTPKAVPWYLRFLPLRYVPGLRRFYYWLMDDKSQPLPDLELAASSGPSPEANAKSDENPLQPRALELGCATGRYLQRLKENGWEVVGVEPSERPASLARAAGLVVHCGTLATCELPQESFDAAAAWMVIEHVPDPRETLTGLAKLLKPRGQLLISIPNAGSWEPAVFGRFWCAWELPRHLHSFTPESIERLLLESGFTEIAVIHQRSMLFIIGSLGMMLLSRWPRSRLGRLLISYPDHPHLLVQVLLAPVAHLMAFLRQSGRLTITARRDGQQSASGGCQPSEEHNE